MTEDEAKKKWCPDSLVVFVNEPTNELSPGCNRVIGHTKTMKPLSGLPDNSTCIGSACMAWRWEREQFLRHKKTGQLMPANPGEAYDGSLWTYTTEQSQTKGYCGRAGKL